MSRPIQPQRLFMVLAWQREWMINKVVDLTFPRPIGICIAAILGKIIYFQATNLFILHSGKR